MDDNTLVGLIGESLLGETAARREAGRLILEFARYGRLDQLLANGAHPTCPPTIAAEVGALAARFGLAGAMPSAVETA